MSAVKTRHGLIAGLDVGTTKVCCFIAKAENRELRILGIGHQLSRGMKNGAVVDMEEAEMSIRAAVDAAEQMAKERVREIVVNISGGRPYSHSANYAMNVAGHEISDNDIRRLLEHAKHTAPNAEGDLLHSIAVDYTVDQNDGVRDPRGMYGEQLGVTIHQVRANPGPVRNLSTVVNRCHLAIESKVVSAYAAALACLVDDEKELGVTCVDLGGGTTSISVFRDNHLKFIDTIPVGGVHVTNDIARGLSTPLAQAERLKVLFGNALPSTADDRELLKVPLVGEDEDQGGNQVPRSMLVQIIQPRLEETFELVRNCLEANGFDKVAGRRVVLTGGASQLQGLRELAGEVLNKQIRMGKPNNLLGLPEAARGPAFSTCAGLLEYAMLNPGNQAGKGDNLSNNAASGGALGKIAGWIRKNF